MSKSAAECPIGLESTHWLCSAGTCAVCLDDLRKQVGARDARLAGLREILAEILMVAGSENTPERCLNECAALARKALGDGR